MGSKAVNKNKFTECVLFVLGFLFIVVFHLKKNIYCASSSFGFFRKIDQLQAWQQVFFQRYLSSQASFHCKFLKLDGHFTGMID